jgi:Leucine-rich repeat (LRR) protein
MLTHVGLALLLLTLNNAPEDNPETVLGQRLAALGAIVGYEHRFDARANRFETSTCIQTVDFVNTDVQADTLLELQKLPRLISVSFLHSRLPTDGWAIIAKLPALTRVTFTGSQIDEKGFAKLGANHKLAIIRLSDVALDSAALDALSQISSLKELGFYSCNLPTRSLSKIISMSSLEELDLNATHIDFDSVSFASNASLKSLALRRMDASDNIIRATNLPDTLRSLDISYNRHISDAAVNRLVSLRPELELLDISGTAISNESVASLRRLRNLVSLRLDDVPLTDACCKDLSHLQRLEWLSISGTQITDRGTAQLESLGNLAGITAYDTSITVDGKERLEQSIAGLHVAIGKKRGLPSR